jgi:hypothetical protein
MASAGGRLKSFVVGCAVAPTAVVAAGASCRSLAALAGQRFAWPFVAGLTAYPLLHILLQPVTFYVVGHELTHSVAAVLSGARVKSMKVGSGGGHVVVDKSNVFIALAPYVVPLWTVLWICAWRLLALWHSLPGWSLAAGVGATLSFHFMLTAGVLWQEHQTDLDQAGGVFSSMSLILLVNSLVLAVALRCLFPGHISMRGWASIVGAGTASFWRAAASAAGWAAHGLSSRLSSRGAA